MRNSDNRDDADDSDAKRRQTLHRRVRMQWNDAREKVDKLVRSSKDLSRLKDDLECLEPSAATRRSSNYGIASQSFSDTVIVILGSFTRLLIKTLGINPSCFRGRRSVLLRIKPSLTLGGFEICSVPDNGSEELLNPDAMASLSTRRLLSAARRAGVSDNEMIAAVLRAVVDGFENGICALEGFNVDSTDSKSASTTKERLDDESRIFRLTFHGRERNRLV